MTYIAVMADVPNTALHTELPASVATSAAPGGLTIFDLDGTLTRHDTLLPFLGGFIRRHPEALLGLLKLPLALLAFAGSGRDRGALKSYVIRMVMGGAKREDVEAYAQWFVASLHDAGRFLPQALAALGEHRRAGDHLVLLSASPDLYVPCIGRSLGFERTICTELAWQGDRLQGALKSANRRGEEKRRCLELLRGQYPGLKVAAYGNSASDLDLLRCVDRALLVNGSRFARGLAAKYGIPCGRWT